MILVDSSVWINYFNGITTRETDSLDQLLGKQQLITGDIILAEVLQGFRSDKDFYIARDLLTLLPCHILSGQELAIQSSIHFRNLRKKGVTIRKTVDAIIATFCIYNDHTLLHSDRDFEPFQTHLGLKVV